MTREELSRLETAHDIVYSIDRCKMMLGDIMEGARIRVISERMGRIDNVEIGKEMLEHIKEEVVMHLEARVNELQKQFDEL